MTIQYSLQKKKDVIVILKDEGCEVNKLYIWILCFKIQNLEVNELEGIPFAHSFLQNRLVIKCLLYATLVSLSTRSSVGEMGT